MNQPVFKAADRLAIWIVEFRFKGQGSGAWFLNPVLVFESEEGAIAEMTQRVEAFGETTQYRIRKYVSE
jgi:hypothetical protein